VKTLNCFCNSRDGFKASNRKGVVERRCYYAHEFLRATYPNHIRIFVSSTFHDIMGECDELMTRAWPELRRFCRERQVEPVEVDLLWGIAEEQSTRKETLKLCLDKIRACRPFFIGLLGERYGWVPGEDAFTADLLARNAAPPLN
jgi:hypothetical protein